MYILDTGRIAQLVGLGADEIQVAGSFSKEVFWEQSSVDPGGRIRTFLLRKPGYQVIRNYCLGSPTNSVGYFKRETD